MTGEQLEQFVYEKFEECLINTKKGTPIEPGFWSDKNGQMIFVPFGPIGEMLNSGDGKDRLFALLRVFLEDKNAQACVVFTESWMFQPNETAKTLEGGWENHIDKGFKKLVDGGYGNVYEVLWMIGQTPTHVCMMSRKFETMIVNGERQLVFHGPVDKVLTDNSDFKGRVKMFGEISEEEVQHYYNEYRKPKAAS